MSLWSQTALKFLQLPLILALFLFSPPGTIDYWQGWLFSAVFFCGSLFSTVYVGLTDPALLKRRLNAGAKAEQRPVQKRVMRLMFFCFALILVLPALDHRWGWSNVPEGIVLAANILVLASYFAILLVFRANAFAAATIALAENHKLISTGPYAYVRHPMYSAALVFMPAIPLALGSYWGLLAVLPAVGLLIWRILDEEEFLKQSLPGYPEYTRKVKSRLIPGVW